MKTFVSHHPQVTIFNGGLLLALITSLPALRFPPAARLWGYDAHGVAAADLTRSGARVNLRLHKTLRELNLWAMWLAWCGHR